MRRVRRDHTCISLELFDNEDSDLCDKCYAFRQRLKGIGRRPGKNAKPKCEKPWFLTNINSREVRLVNKKKKAIEVLGKYNYKVSDEEVERDIESRLYSKENYRKNWIELGLKNQPKLKPLVDIDESDAENEKKQLLM